MKAHDFSVFEWLSAWFHRKDENVVIPGGGWDESHLILGPYHLWVDSSGDLRIKGGVPTSDTDGVVVGSQS